MGNVIPLRPGKLYAVQPASAWYEGTPRGLVAAITHAVALTAGGGKQYIELCEGRPLMATVIRVIENGRSATVHRAPPHRIERPPSPEIRARYEPPDRKPVRKRKGPHYAPPAWPGII